MTNSYYNSEKNIMVKCIKTCNINENKIKMCFFFKLKMQVNATIKPTRASNLN